MSTTQLTSAAVVNFAPTKGAVEIRDVEIPTIGDSDVMIEVANVGVCGSDLHQVDGRSFLARQLSGRSGA